MNEKQKERWLNLKQAIEDKKNKTIIRNNDSAEKRKYATMLKDLIDIWLAVPLSTQLQGQKILTVIEASLASKKPNPEVSKLRKQIEKRFMRANETAIKSGK